MKENLIVINDNKFKSIFISVNFMRKLSKEENHKNALLASILRKGTSKLNSEEKIDLKLKEGVDENMSCLQERLVQEFRQEIRNEFKEGYKAIFRPLILNKVPDELMLQSKKITKKQLEEIKK